LGLWPALQIVQRYITVGDPAALSSVEHVELKQRVAANFSVHHTNVLVVGSAKLGFSIAPHKRWRPFGDTSDIDVAIVSRDLFEKIWREVSGLLTIDPLVDWQHRDKFASYHLKGWMRPDMLPNSPACLWLTIGLNFFGDLRRMGAVVLLR
jgi:hypothetical protein